MYEKFDFLWSLTLPHYTQKICRYSCSCFEQSGGAFQRKSDQLENNLFSHMWLRVFLYLNDTDFTSLLQNCSELYFLSLDVCVRRYSYKYNVCSWLD